MNVDSMVPPLSVAEMTRHHQARLRRMTNEAYSAGRLADRAQIQDVITRWCRAVDRLDIDNLESLYHADATEDHVVFKGNFKVYLADLRKRQPDVEFVTHFLGNQLIEFAGPDLALAETYCFSIMRFKEGAPLPPLVGLPSIAPSSKIDLGGHSRYIDRFERRAGEWRIASRTTVVDWVTAAEVAQGSVAPGLGWVMGRRDAQDPLWKERSALGLQ